MRKCLTRPAANKRTYQFQAGLNPTRAEMPAVGLLILGYRIGASNRAERTANLKKNDLRV